MENSPYRIQVDVKTRYEETQSEPEMQRYLFSYTITIRNTGNVAARLLTRYWLITDADGKTQEVTGEGVVGEQPYLAPGQSFRYTSATMIETQVGSMQGSYQMLADDGMRFDAPIQPFRLACPNVLH